MSATTHPTLPAFRLTPEAQRFIRRRTARDHARQSDLNALTLLGSNLPQHVALEICARIMARGEDVTTTDELKAVRQAMRRHNLSEDLIAATWRRKAGASAGTPAPLRIGRRGR